MARALGDATVYRRMHAEPTLADALAGGVAARTVALARAHAAEVRVVDEDAIVDAMAYAARELGLLLEGAAATALGALLDGRQLPGPSGSALCLIASGRNVDRARLRAAIGSRR